MGILEAVIELSAEHEKNVFGEFDMFAKKIERTLHVTLIAREGKVKLLGEAAYVEKAKNVLAQLKELSKRGNVITEQNVDYALSLAFEGNEDGLLEVDKDIICHTSVSYTHLDVYKRQAGVLDVLIISPPFC